MGGVPLAAASSETCLVVAAHPDDEVLGAGIWMHRRAGGRIYILHLTDGSPRGEEAARQAGFTSATDYATARRQELESALALIPISPAQCRCADVVDGEAYLHLSELIAKTSALITTLHPTVVMTHCYEGGHPDHDAAALIVAAAQKRTPHFFRRLEFPLYHALPHRDDIVFGEFLWKVSSSDGGDPQEEVALTKDEETLKRNMLGCFRSQQTFLDNFGLSRELIREAPEYDFSRAPHEGQLLYEKWRWDVSGELWRARAIDVWPR